MADNVYSNPGTRGFQTFINDHNRIVVYQEDMLLDSSDSIELSAEEAKELAGYLLQLAKKMK
jgi:hypothetical protein